MILKAVVVGAFATNTYIVGSEETKEAMVIDPAAEVERVQKELEAQGLKVVVIVNTHGHSDHTGAVAPLVAATGAPYAIHAGDIPLLKQGSRSRVMFPDFQDPPEPDRTLKGGDTIKVGELSFLVLETPGHTPGSVCLYGHGVAFTGDTLFQMSVGRTDTPGGSHAQLINSIMTKLMVLPPETVVLPGHGPSTTVSDEKWMNPFLGGMLRGF